MRGGGVKRDTPMDRKQKVDPPALTLQLATDTVTQGYTTKNEAMTLDKADIVHNVGGTKIKQIKQQHMAAFRACELQVRRQ